MNDESSPLIHLDEPDLAVPPLPSSDADSRALHVPVSRHTAHTWRLSVLQTVLLIAFGGAIGANLRYFVTQWAGQVFGTAFPYGTLIINVSGSFLLGVIYTVLLRLDPAYTPALRLLLGVGVIGGYTTFSSFSYETSQLLLERSALAGLLNPLLSVAGGVISCLLGIVLAEYMTGGRY
jgi:CrcB protein